MPEIFSAAPRPAMLLPRTSRNHRQTCCSSGSSGGSRLINKLPFAVPGFPFEVFQTFGKVGLLDRLLLAGVDRTEYADDPSGRPALDRHTLLVGHCILLLINSRQARPEAKSGREAGK